MRAFHEGGQVTIEVSDDGAGIDVAAVRVKAVERADSPYSVAMLLSEYPQSLAGWNARIIASDISREILARAQAGRFSQLEINRGLPARLLVKYFEQQGSRWEIKPAIRRMVEFSELNLTELWSHLPAMHLILMRNVLIYFDSTTKTGILEKVGRLLRPDGYLLLGCAETTINLHDSFEPVSLDGGVCFRQRRRPSMVTPSLPSVSRRDTSPFVR